VTIRRRHCSDVGLIGLKPSESDMSNYTSIWSGVRSDKFEFVDRVGEFALKNTDVGAVLTLTLKTLN